MEEDERGKKGRKQKMEKEKGEEECNFLPFLKIQSRSAWCPVGSEDRTSSVRPTVVPSVSCLGIPEVPA